MTPLLKSLFDGIVERLSPNRSARIAGSKVQGLVIHTTEGSFAGSLGWMLNPASQVSAHYIISDVVRPGEPWNEVVRLVPEDEKAWTARSANSVTINYELAGYSARTRADWLIRFAQQIETVAALVAQDAEQYGIPVRRGFPGILGHGDLYQYGFPNSHTDPGENFPWDIFLAKVRAYQEAMTVVPVVERPVVRPGRPPGVPWRIPTWAWRLHAWFLTKPMLRGERPSHPQPIPAWFWLWRKWKMGVYRHPGV